MAESTGEFTPAPTRHDTDGPKGPDVPAPPKDDDKTKTDTSDKGDTKPKPDADDSDSDSDTKGDTDKPQKEPVELRKDEHGRYVSTVVNRQADVEKRIREEVQEKVRQKQVEGSWLNPKNWYRKGKFKFGEDYQVQVGIKMLRQAVQENNNVFMTLDIVGNSVKKATISNPDQDRAAHESEAEAKLKQIALGDQVGEGDTKFQKVEEATGPLKQLMVDEVFRPIVEGRITDEKQLQEELRKFVDKHKDHSDPSVKDQLDKMFGQGATEFNERAQLFASDFLEVGQAIAADREAHEFGLDKIGEKVVINLANTEWAHSTQVQFNRADRLATKLKATRFGPWVNEATVGLAVSIDAFAITRGAGRTIGFAAGATALVGAYERSRNLKKDRATHGARTEYGHQVDMTARSGLKGKLVDALDMDKKMEEFRLKEIASVNELLHATAGDTRVSDADARGLNTLLSLDITPANMRDREALIRRVAEIQTRLRYSADVGAGFINFGSKQQTEEGRLALVEGIVSGKEKLIAAIEAEGNGRPDAEAEVARLLAESRGKWQQRFSKDKKDQDTQFTLYRVQSSLTHGAGAGALAAVAGLLSQQAVAEIGGHPPIDNKPVNPTILEKNGLTFGHHHQLENAEAIYGLQSALENNQPNDVIAKFGELGVQAHTVDGRIIIDKVNGVDVNAAVPPSLTYDPETSSFDFAGEIPPELKQKLEENYFNVGSTTSGSESVYINPQPQEVTVPGTDLKVSIPVGTELRQGPGGTYELYSLEGTAAAAPVADPLAKDLLMTEPAKSEPIKLADGIRFDGSGNIVDKNIIRPDLVTLGEPQAGSGRIETAKWLETNSANVDKYQWYGYGTKVSEKNELKLYDYRVNDHAIKFDMLSMENSYQNGNFPPSVDVPDVIKEDRAVFTFWDKSNPKEPIIVKAEHGQITLDKNSNELVKVWVTNPDGSQGWKDVRNAEVAHVVLGDMRDFEEASDIGYMDILNRNVSAGEVQMRPDGLLVSSYATATGTGSEPGTIPGGEVSKFEAVQHTKVTFPDGWEPMPIATAVTARRHLGPVIVPPRDGEVIEFPGSSFNYYEGGWDLFTKPDGSPASLSDILHFKGYYNGKQTSEAFPPRIDGFNSGATLTTEISESAEGVDAVKAIKDKFDETDDMYLILSGAIGDVVVNSAYVEGLRNYADKSGRNKNITLIVPPNVVSLIEPLAAKYNCKIETEQRFKGIDKARELIESGNISNALVFELDHTTGRPAVDTLPNDGLVVEDLFAASLGLYKHDRSGNERFTAFMGDLLSIPEGERISIQAQTELPADSAQMYESLKQKFHIDDSKPQVGLVVEASHKMKRYSLAQWNEVLTQMKQQRPDADINIFFNPNPNSGSYTEDELRQAFGSIPDLRLLSGSIPEQMVLLGNQNVVLSNDTGFAHVAATIKDGPQVVSIHLPIFPPNVWVSDTDRHLGILPDAARLQDNFNSEEDDESKKWINRIQPSDIAQAALDRLNTPPVRPSTQVPPAPETVTQPTTASTEGTTLFGGATESTGLSEDELDAMFDEMPPVSEIQSADSFTGTMNQELAAETDTAHVFMFDTRTLAQFLQERSRRAFADGRFNDLFGGRAVFDDLDIRLRGQQILVSGRMQHTRNGRLRFTDALFHITPDGQMEIVGEPRLVQEDGVRGVLAPDEQAVQDMRAFGELTTQFINQRINGNWEANSFAMFDGQIGISTERRAEPETTIAPAPEPATPETELEATGPMPAVDDEETTTTLPPVPPQRTPAHIPTEAELDSTLDVNRNDIIVDPEGIEWEVRRVRRINLNGAVRPSRREHSDPYGIVLRRVGGRPWERRVVDPIDLDRAEGWHLRSDESETEAQQEQVRILNPVEITSSDDMISDMVQELETDTAAQHQFDLDPQLLSEFLVRTTKDSNTDLLGDVLNVEDLILKVDNGRLIMSGKMKIGGGEELTLEDMEYTLGAEGRLVPVGVPEIAELRNIDPSDTVAVNRARKYEVPMIKLRTFGMGVGRLLQNKLGDKWQVNGYALHGNKLSILAGAQTELSAA